MNQNLFKPLYFWFSTGTIVKMAPNKKPQPASTKAAAPLPDNFSNAQAKKAVDALMAFAKKAAAEREETELLEKEEYVWLCVNTKHPGTKRKIMPQRM